MDQHKLKELANKIADGTATDEELKQYLAYLSDLEGKQETDVLTAVEQESLKFSLKNSIDQHIRQAIDEKPYNKGMRYRNIAAATLLIGFSLLFVYWYNNLYHPINTLTQKHQQIVTITPGSNKAVLTLSDGSQLLLDEAKEGTIALQGDQEVVKTSDGKLSYKGVDKGEATTKPVYNTVTTPKGGQYQIKLPDASRVWLNAASSITYPTTFTGKERRVEVHGEVYFEISRDQKRPFIVQASTQKVVVLGTHFNIKDYPGEATETTLVEGSVKVVVNGLGGKERAKGQVLKIGETALSSGEGIEVRQADLEEVMAWRNGFFKFQDDLSDIMLQIARWYNVEVSYKLNAEKRLAFGGKISRNRSLKEVLSIIEETGNVHFKIEGRRIMVFD